MKAKLSLLASIVFLISIFVLNGCAEEAGENFTELAETAQEQVVDTPKTEEPVMEDETSGESVLEVRAAFAEKFDKEIESITVTPTHESENHMRGMVKLGEAIGDGGMFLAAKVEGKWRIVVDGHGVYTCLEIEPYNFPDDMIFDCYSQ